MLLTWPISVIPLSKGLAILGGISHFRIILEASLSQDGLGGQPENPLNICLGKSKFQRSVPKYSWTAEKKSKQAPNRKEQIFELRSREAENIIQIMDLTLLNETVSLPYKNIRQKLFGFFGVYIPL